MPSSTWRDRLVLGAVLTANCAHAYLYLYADPRLRSALKKLALGHVVAYFAMMWHHRRTLTWRIISANGAVGAFCHFAAAAIIALGVKFKLLDRLFAGTSSITSVTRSDFYSAGGDIALVVAAGCGSAYFAFTHAVRDLPHQNDAHQKAESIAHAVETAEAASMAGTRVDSSVFEPAPPASSQFSTQRPDFLKMTNAMLAANDAARLSHLSSLQRVEGILLLAQQKQAKNKSDDGDNRTANSSNNTAIDDAIRTVRQEVERVGAAFDAHQAAVESNDVLTKLGEGAEWLVQKLPELAELDVSDLIMAKCVADIQKHAVSKRMIFVPQERCRAIHPISRDTAMVKCEERGAALRASRDAIAANGNRLSEALINSTDTLAIMRSITSFNCIQMTDGNDPQYVLYEGNGRLKGIELATFDKLLIECKLFEFRDRATLERMRHAVRETQKAKGVPVTE